MRRTTASNLFDAAWKIRERRPPSGGQECCSVHWETVRKRVPDEEAVVDNIKAIWMKWRPRNLGTHHPERLFGVPSRLLTWKTAAGRTNPISLRSANKWMAEDLRR